MLSTENPPSDPLLASNLNSVISNDDLPTSSDLDPPRDHHNQPTSFSIRDHVFSARSKDISKNWPFSLKTLQLCLRNGLEDPLPPFQSLDAVRNQSSEIKLSDVKEQPSVGVHSTHYQKLDNDRLIQKLSDACVGVDPITTSTCGAENDIPATSASVYQSGTATVPSIRPLEADNQTVLEGSTVQNTLSRKIESTTKPLNKKCKLIVKFGAPSDRTSTEDIALNSSAVSELMASKTCPVCKTFSSSSNTTLNAHIDQCLSSDSTPKWASGAKSQKHKIKPRKTKFLADVYATAKQCTLEELDRRNGANWAAISIFPAQERENLEVCDEALKQKVSSFHPDEDLSDVDRVYIDANGTKLRILSKLGDSSVISKASDAVRPSKTLKGGKGNQCLSIKKKSRHGKKGHKLLATRSRKLQKAHAFQMLEEQRGLLGEGSNTKEGPLLHKPSKRGQLGKWYATKSPSADNSQSCANKSRVSRFQNDMNASTGNLAYQSESNCKKQTTFDQRIAEKGKRPRSSLMEARNLYNTERPAYAVKRIKGQQGKMSTSCHEGPTLRPRISSQNSGSFLSKKAVCHDAMSISEASAGFRSKLFRSSLGITAITSEAGRNSCKSLKVNKPCNTVDKDKVQAAVQFIAYQDCDTMQTESHGDVGKDLNEQLCGRQTRTGNQLPQSDDIESLGAPVMESWDYGKENCENRGSLVGTDEDDDSDYDDSSDENYDDDNDNNVSKHTNFQPLSIRIDTSMSESVGVEFRGLNAPSMIQSDPLESQKNYRRELGGCETFVRPTEQNLFMSRDKGILGQTGHLPMGFDSSREVGHADTFTEVDPIPIPGPPGSFLPSPRDMGSDDFAGNSSLTSSRVHSHDQMDLADRNSSESPISATSTISNTTADKSNHMKYEEINGATTTTKEKAASGFPSNIVSAINSAVSSRDTSSKADLSFETEKLAVNKFSVKRSLSINYEPCCCQRKERFSKGLSLDCQNSQLMRRRMLTSITVPDAGMQTSLNPSREVNSIVSRPDSVLHFSDCTDPKPVAATHVMKPSGESVASKRSPGPERRSAGHTDLNSPSPSPSNPVLRLMGKNLMVVNKGEESPVALGHGELNYQCNRATGFTAEPKITAGGEARSFHHMPPHGSLTYGQDPYGAVGVYNFKNSYEHTTNSMVQQNPTRFLSDTLSNQRINSCFANRINVQTNVDDFSLWNSGLARQRYKLGLQFDDSRKKAVVSDDVADGGGVTYSQSSRNTPLNSFNGAIPMNQSHSSFSSFQQHDPAMVANPKIDNLYTLPSRQSNTSPVRWGCMQEGSVSMLRGSLMAASTSSGHASTAVYRSPRPS